MSTPQPLHTRRPDPATVHVRTPSRKYDVIISAGALAHLGEHLTRSLAGKPPAKAMIFADAGLPAPLVQAAASSLRTAGVDCPIVPISPSEEHKSLQTITTMLEALTAHALERSHPVIAIGGGITGDLVGFAAASYRRGVPWINCPTTLLSMVDASVGGKTGANVRTSTGLKKNMAGAFWQPHLVLADVETLASLPDRHFRSGLAECIKHAMLAGAFDDPTLLNWTRTNLQPILARDPAILSELIARNVRVKATVVGDDEREEHPDERGGRALLNLGHTFAHAIEPLPRLSPTASPADAPLQHGEAVALGLVAAATLSVRLNLAPASLADDTRQVLASAGLPTRVAGLPSFDEFTRLMRDDKKSAGGSMRFIVPLAGGTCRVIRDPNPEALAGAIDAIRA